MGKKIPYDQALEAAKTEPNESIYARPNKYGYRININHPQIKPLYDCYKRHTGAMILSEEQRQHFESLIFQMIERSENNE